MIAERVGRGSPVEFYERELVPVVFERLDQVFPEFGFVRDARGWRATNDEATRSVFAARADRVVCHRPGGFLVFGADPVRWLALVVGEERPTGRAFVEAVRELARRAGIDTTPIDTPRAVPELRQAGEAIRDAVFDVAHRTLKDKRHNQTPLAYLARRGIPADRLIAQGLVGVAPSLLVTHNRLRGRGFKTTDVEASGVLADARFEGRLIGCWRDAHGHAVTLWGRAVSNAEPHYLFARGATRPAIPYLAHEAIRQGERSLVLVEGMLDALSAHAHGDARVVALGGSSIAPGSYRELAQLGVHELLLVADADEAGRRLELQAAESWLNAGAPLALHLADRRVLDGASDLADAIARSGSRVLASLGLNARDPLAELVDASAGDGERLLRLLAKLPESPVDRREALVERVAQSLGVAPAQIRERLAATARASSRSTRLLAEARDALRHETAEPRDSAHAEATHLAIAISDYLETIGHPT